MLTHKATASFGPLPSLDQLCSEGRSLREKRPRQSHAVWKTPQNRLDPISMLEKSSQGRIASLVPIRYGRMAQSPFTFYRGAALNYEHIDIEEVISWLKDAQARKRLQSRLAEARKAIVIEHDFPSSLKSSASFPGSKTTLR